MQQIQQQPDLDSLPSEDFLQWFASFAIERGNLRNSHNDRLAFYAPHPLFECSLLALRLFLRRLSHIVLATFIVDRAVRCREARLGAKES
jgi:hypothetical protein